MFWGWSMIRGVITEPITDGVTRIVKLTVICGIALSFGLYSQFLVDWLWQSPDRLASIIAGGEPSDKVNFLDSIFEKIWGYAEIWNTAASNNSNALGIPDLSIFHGLDHPHCWRAMTGYAAISLRTSQDCSCDSIGNWSNIYTSHNV
jgi:type IV secretion system protein VirB6